MPNVGNQQDSIEIRAIGQKALENLQQFNGAAIFVTGTYKK
jgi:hypothetical protein